MKKKGLKKMSETQNKEQQILTGDELAFNLRAKTEDTGWKETITEESMTDFSLSDDPYTLPAPAVKKEKERMFKYRWAEKNTKRIDFLRNLEVPRRWWICNNVNSPYLKAFIDPGHGGIQKLDQILMFKPWSHHMAERKMIDNLNQHQRNSGEISQEKAIEKTSFGEIISGRRAKINDMKDIIHDKIQTNDLGDLIAD
jgi:hypothetical protein